MDVLGVFAKYPRPGSVKTRLADHIGAESACQIYEQFLAIILQRFVHFADQRILACWPPQAISEFSTSSTAGWQVAAQRGADLGARMESFFQDAMAAGAERVVVIGSDSPTLPAPHVEEALERLREVPVVLGPSDDGGYYLLGLRREIPPIFADMPWSSAQVWSETVRRLRGCGLPFAELAPWYDVDNAEDLNRLAQELRRPEYASPLWRPLRTVVSRAVGTGDIDRDQDVV